MLQSFSKSIVIFPYCGTKMHFLQYVKNEAIIEFQFESGIFYAWRQMLFLFKNLTIMWLFWACFALTLKLVLGKHFQEQKQFNAAFKFQKIEKRAFQIVFSKHIL